MITIAFFNNKGGVGRTSLVYHLAWMYGELGLNVVAADLDPQANLTSMFLDEDRLQDLWPEGRHPDTIQGAVESILHVPGDIQPPHVEEVSDRIGLVPGDLALSDFEGKLSEAWSLCQNRNEASLRLVTAFYCALMSAAQKRQAGLVLVDVAPNLGAINRSALIASDFVVIPLASDLPSVRALRSLGPWLGSLRETWSQLRQKNPSLPSGSMTPAGYVVIEQSTLTVRAHLRLMEKMPAEYRRAVLDTASGPSEAAKDPNCLATLRNYRSLMPLAQAVHKPMFLLKPADGAIGAHVEAVRDCYRDFRQLATYIGNRCGVPVPGTGAHFGSETSG
jgi:chromosome partitioning protein